MAPFFHIIREFALFFEVKGRLQEHWVMPKKGGLPGKGQLPSGPDSGNGSGLCIWLCSAETTLCKNLSNASPLIL